MVAIQEFDSESSDPGLATPTVSTTPSRTTQSDALIQETEEKEEEEEQSNAKTADVEKFLVSFQEAMRSGSQL